MSDQFSKTVFCLPDSSSSHNLDCGDFEWKVDFVHPSLTLNCQPRGNKETLLWRCDAKIKIVAVEKYSERLCCEMLGLTFNSHKKSSESRSELCRTSSAAVKLELNVLIIRSYVIDLSSATNALVLGSCDAARFEIDGRVVYLSKHILTRCSPFFNAMFNRDFLEKTTDSYALREVDFRQVLHLMAIIHRKTAFIDASSVAYLAKLADMYCVREIADLCKEFLLCDEEIEDREIVREHLSRLDNEKIVIESKAQVQRSFGHAPLSFEIGAFQCKLNLSLNFFSYNSIMMTMSPQDKNRNLMWHCVAQLKSVEEYVNESLQQEDTFSFRNSVCEQWVKVADDRLKLCFNVNIIESDVIDLSSPENKLLSDPTDAVSLQIDGEKLWFSKKFLTLTCPVFGDSFKSPEKLYIVYNVKHIQFLHFMALLHLTKFQIDAHSVQYLLILADRFNCDYVTDRCELFLRDKKCELGRDYCAQLADWHNLIGLMTKLKVKS